MDDALKVATEHNHHTGLCGGTPKSLARPCYKCTVLAALLTRERKNTVEAYKAEEGPCTNYRLASTKLCGHPRSAHGLTGECGGPCCCPKYIAPDPATIAGIEHRAIAAASPEIERQARIEALEWAQSIACFPDAAIDAELTQLRGR